MLVKYGAAYIAFAVIFLILDGMWLKTMGERLYRAELGDLMLQKPRIGSAVLFYLIYVAGVIGFVVAPALASGRPLEALVRGAAFGFVAYATYDLTNQATLKIWSMKITMADLAWGAFATGVASTAATAIVGRLLPR